MGPEKACMVINDGIMIAELYTEGNSAVQYTTTQNLLAKRFYLLNVAFSITAIGNERLAVVSGVCQISGAGVISEALEMDFMWCGNAAQTVAFQAEGKLIPPKFRKSLKKGTGNNL